MQPGSRFLRESKGGLFTVVNAMDRVASRARAEDRATEDAVLIADGALGHTEEGPPSAHYLVPSLRKLAGQVCQRQPKPPSTSIVSLDAAQHAFQRILKHELAQRAGEHRVHIRPSLGAAAEPSEGGVSHLPHFADAENFLRDAERTQARRSSLLEALATYNPTLDPLAVRRVADRVNPQRWLAHTKRLREVLQHVGADQFVSSVLPRWRLKCQREWQSHGMETIRLKEEEAGIIGHFTLSSGGRRQHQRAKAFVRYQSDYQVNEVLPSGRVVTFTGATRLPDGSPLPKELSASAKEALKREESQQPGEQREQDVFLHFVLYREATPLAETFQTLAAFADAGPDSVVVGVRVTEADFAVNAPVDDTMVAVQTCSLRVRLPPQLTLTQKREQCRRLCRQLARVNVGAAQGPRPKIQIQLLGWRKFPCSARFGVLCRAQYAVMLRGLLHHSGFLEAKALGVSRCVPNFFGPAHFGPLDCPFRYFDVWAAVEQGRFDAAALVAAVLACWGGNAGSSPWVAETLHRLSGDEERSGVWREHFRSIVPKATQQRAREAKAALLWNVVVSSRVGLSSRGAREEVLAAVPEPGDFVLRSPASEDAASPEVATTADRQARSAKQRPAHAVFSPALVKPELLPMVSLSSAFHDVVQNAASTTTTSADAVTPIFSVDDAAQFSLLDVVAPVDVHEVSEELNVLATDLGFAPVRHAPPFSARDASLPRFRSMFVAASGFPRTAKPWVKEFVEPSGAHTNGETEGIRLEYKLSTDLDLAVVDGTVATASRRDFAEKSRGHQAAVWPIGRRGRGIADRLPPGLLASAALSHATQSASAPSQRNASKCLVMQFTLPAETYCGNFLRELGLVESLCPATSPDGPSLPRCDGASEDGAKDRSTDGHAVGVARTLQAEPKEGEEAQDKRFEWSEGNILSLSQPRSHRGA